jgi:RHO1 GDP-GTP exchange protein 1/2
VQSVSGDNIMPANTNGEVTDNRYVYPLQLHHNGRSGGIHTYFTDSAPYRQEWKAKLEEALGLRGVVQESNKVDMDSPCKSYY